MKNLFIFIRLTIAAVLALSVALTAAITSPPPAQAASQVFKFSGSGLSAYAGWSSYGDINTETYVYVSEEMYNANGEKMTGTNIYFGEYSWRIDKKGNWVFVSERYGFGSADFTIDQKLTGATVTASVPTTIGSVDRRGNYTWKDGGVVSLSVTWTGQGGLVRTNSNYHYHSKSKGSGFSMNGHSKGAYRDATATGELNGIDLGLSSWASMSQFRWSDIYIDRYSYIY